MSMPRHSGQLYHTSSNRFNFWQKAGVKVGQLYVQNYTRFCPHMERNWLNRPVYRKDKCWYYTVQRKIKQKTL